MGAGIAASPHCAESWIGRCSLMVRVLGPFPSRSLRTSSGVASVSSLASSSEALLPASASLLPCGKRSCRHRFCLCSRFRLPCGRHFSRSPRFSARRLRFGCPSTLLASNRPPFGGRLIALRSFGPGPGAFRPPDHRSSFRGPSWADRSFRRPVQSENRSFKQSEEDQLFRRLLPASLSGDPS
jgi:hypothetical protein